VRRFATHGWDIWSAPGYYGALRDRLSLTCAFIDSAAAEVMRIEQGLSRWGRELTDAIIPIEANLERRTIDYEKGCYIGQEVISRMKMSGQTNKRLCGLISLDNSPLRHGMKLAPSSNLGTEAGWITSAARSERLGREIALGYIKRGFNNPGTSLALLAGPPGSIPVQVASLPFL
jgi:folate-binding protein YgfZ